MGSEREAARHRDGQSHSQNQQSKLPSRGYRETKTQKLADKAENTSVVKFKPIRLKLSSPPELWKTGRKEIYEERIMMKPFLQTGTAL